MMLLLPFDCHNHVHLGGAIGATSNSSSCYTPSSTNSITSTPASWSTLLPLFIPKTDNHICLFSNSNNNNGIIGQQPSSTLFSSNNHDLDDDGNTNSNQNNNIQQQQQIILDMNQLRLCGMAIMSTNPSDFGHVKQLAIDLQSHFSGHSTTSTATTTTTTTLLRTGTANERIHVIPCFGVHPWWLHELTEEQWLMEFSRHTNSNDTNNCNHRNNNGNVPAWVNELERTVRETPGSVIGEIGLDGFHFNPHTKQLTCSMEKQVLAFTYQMKLAYKLNCPVSIHAVQCFGPLLDALNDLRKSKQLPRILYFHAFAGKIGTVDQILALCEQSKNNKNTNIKSNNNNNNNSNTRPIVYFGFAPVVNFRSPKTIHVIRRIGLKRLVLETDHEEANLILQSIFDGIMYISKALNTSPQNVIDQTTKNAYNLYQIPVDDDK